MSTILGDMHVPSVAEVERICAVSNRVVRNLQITHCYHRLSAAMAQRTGSCGNWCTFATWASRQAGATIRGEDLLDRFKRRLNRRAEYRHPVRSLWRAALRKGLFEPDTTIGVLVREIHTPFDAFERASEAVARGNLKVFQEIGHVFARYLAECPEFDPPTSPTVTRFLDSLAPGDPPGGQRYLRSAFTRYQEQRFVSDLTARAELIVLANLEIGLHEQTRLQPEIRESLEAPLSTAWDLKRRMGGRLLPGAAMWKHAMRIVLGVAAGPIAFAFQRYSSRLAREIITERLMVLGMPDGTSLALGRPLDLVVPDPLRRATHEELVELLGRVAPCHPDRTACAARDWADLAQRMHVIAHVFCAFHERTDLFSTPFTDAQTRHVLDGRLPEGRL